MPGRTPSWRAPQLASGSPDRLADAAPPLASGSPDRLADAFLQLCLDRCGDPLAQFGHLYLADQLAEESPDHQSSGFGKRYAARHQIEQVLVFQPTACTCMPGASDLAGQNLQVGDRVDPSAVSEHEVSVALVAVCPDSLRPDDYVPDPHRVCALALQRPLIRDP